MMGRFHMIPAVRALRRWVAAGLMAAALAVSAANAPAAVLLNDSFADGSRAETALPTESAVYAGVSGSDGGSLTTTTGAVQNVMGTGSRKVWTYFTSDGSAPDGIQPHNAVQALAVGDLLKASISFTPTGVTSASTSREFRFGAFHDPTDARVQVDTNSDAGGAASPWGDATGYGVQIPLNATASGNNPLQIGKRTSSANTGLISSSNSYTFAPSGGAVYSITSGTNYTLELQLSVVSAAQLDVTARLLQGASVLSSHTVSDTTTAFGGTANIAGSFPAAAGLYTNFDQLFWRMSTNAQASQVDITNFFVEHIAGIPEPSSLALLGVAGAALLRRRRAGRAGLI